MGCDAESTAFHRLLFGPTGFLGGNLNHVAEATGVERIILDRLAVVPVLHSLRFEVQMARRADDVEQIFDAIAAGRCGQFIDERMNGERVINVRYRAHPALPDVILRGPVFGAMVRNIVGQIHPAHAHFEFLSIPGRGIEGGADGGEDAALQPSGRAALGVGAGFHVHGRYRMIEVELDIFFAAPDYLHRLVELLCEDGSFGYVIRFRLAAEPSAQQGNVADDVFLLDAECGGYGLLHGLRILRCRPDGGLAVLHFGYRGGRFHWGVRQHRYIIFGFVDFGCLGEGRVHVADVADLLLRFAGGFEKRFLVGFRIEGGVLAEVPIHLEFLAALHCRPCVVGDDGYPAQCLKVVRRLEAVDHYRLLHALYGECRFVVEAFELSAIDRGAFDRSVDHAGDARIHAEGALAHYDVVQIRGGDAFAHVAEFGWGLQPEFFLLRDRLQGGQRGQFAVAEFLAALVNDLVIDGLAFGSGHLPFFRSRAFQHQTGTGAGFADGYDEVANGAGTICVLRAVLGIADGLFDLDALPIGFEFVGQNHGQDGADPCAHFGSVREDDERAVGFEAQPDSGMPRGIGG